MRWETPLMNQIFGDEHPSLKLVMSLDWGNRNLPMTESAAAGASQPVVPSETKWQVTNYVQLKADETYLQQRDKTLHNALTKWKFLVLIDVSCFEVGRQLDEMDEKQIDQVLSSAVSASRSQSLVQALRFAHFVLGFDDALLCANSNRISEQAQIQLSLRARQSRPEP
jgi:hypothetical protein